MSAPAPSDLAWLRAMVRARCSIALDESKEYLIEARLEPIAWRMGLESVAALVHRARASEHPALLDEIVDAMTTNETSWMRDAHPWIALCTHVLPDVVQRTSGLRPARIWSAACSTGQEPYTIAMMVHQRFGPLDPPVEIVASDISPTVLAKARAATYSQMEVNRGLPAELLVRYFDQDGPSWVLSPRITSMVRFERRNLARSFGAMAPFDVICLRNVLIYFDVATRRDIIARVRSVLRPDGVLLVGAAETLLDVDDTWRRIRVDGATFYRPDARRPSATPSATTPHRRGLRPHSSAPRMETLP